MPRLRPDPQAPSPCCGFMAQLPGWPHPCTCVWDFPGTLRLLPLRQGTEASRGLCWADKLEEASFPRQGEPRSSCHHPVSLYYSCPFPAISTKQDADERAQRDLTKHRGEPQSAPPHYHSQILPHFRIKGQSWGTSASHFCPHFRTSIFILSSCLPPAGFDGKLKGPGFKNLCPA